MRAWTVFLLLLLTTLAGCFDDLPDEVPDQEDEIPEVQGGLGPGNATMYLHAAGVDTWMDTDKATTDQELEETVTVTSPATTHRFPLRPAPEREVLADGLQVLLAVDVQNVVGEFPEFHVALLVAGERIAQAFSSQPLIHFDESMVWPAGADVELTVCVCPADTSVAYQYSLQANGESTVELDFSDAPATNNTGGDSGGASQSGDVSVSKQGDRWVATRTLSFDDAATDRATVDLGSTNGAVTVLQGGTNAHLDAVLKAYGDSEQQARDRLEGMGVDQSAATVVGTLEYYAHGTVPGNQWSNRSIELALSLPSELDSLDVDVTNGAITVDDFQGGDWDLHTVNGAITLNGATLDSLDVSTSNGRITLDATVDDLDASASNGQIVADIRAAGSGDWDLSTSNGAIDLQVTEDATRGYDVTGTTTNGAISFDFQDTEEVGQQSNKNRHERTTDFAGRSIQTSIDLYTVNGSIEAGS